MFAELHTHNDIGSNVRLIDTTLKVDMAIKRAINMGFQGIAITDHESLSAHVEALQYHKKIKEKNPDFKLVLGNEIYLINDDDYSQTNRFFHFILLAKDKIGHRQLRQLSTRAWERVYTYKGVERVPTFYSDIQDVVGNDTGHLIGMTACLGGFFPALVLNNRENEAAEFASWCQSIFGENNFYVELQPGISQEQIQFNTAALKICKSSGFPWVITNDVHYLSKEKRELHAAYLNSKDEDRETSDFYESTYFKSEDEMLQRMDYLDVGDVETGFANTIKVVNSTQEYTLHQETIVPQRELPHAEVQHLFSPWYEQCPSLKHVAYSQHEQDRFCLAECERGTIEKQKPVNEELAKRLDVEFEQLIDISEKLGQRLTSYYNLVQLIIQLMWEISFVGPGRGSAGGFEIAYLMDIIQIDPMEWDLPWWRHISKFRPELPDIDIDSESSKRHLIFEKLINYFESEKCLNIITFRKETAKAATLTACRGLGIDSDLARELSSLVPMVRGRVWSIQECLEGNEDNGFRPLADFVRKVKSHPLLLETIQEIEGLVCGRGVHASGFYIFAQPFIEQNSLMVAPNGTKITCWDMGDSDWCGALKVDVLTIMNLDCMHKTVDLLIADKHIEWQGSVKSTYDKYLHPKALDYITPEMWDLASDGKIVNLFQYDTRTGGEAIRKIRPRNLKELSLGNSVMRLMGNDDMVPIDRFVAFKHNIELWEKEMQSAGLSEKEQSILRPHLLPNYGCSIEQEDMMRLLLDPQIVNFDMGQAHKARKAVAKKKEDLIIEFEKLYKSKGAELGTSQALLDYIWKFCIKPQLGYSFSALHSVAYSHIGLQEMNLAYHYPTLYWQTACLTINASANDEVEDNKSTNYGRIAKAIGDMQTDGVKIALPDINTADFGFKPDLKNEQIVFGLKGINGMGDDVVTNVIENRPYTSIDEFMARNNIDSKAVINLIKAGCFLEIMGNDRYQAMKDFVVKITKEKVAAKTSLTMRNLDVIIDSGILPKKFQFNQRLYIFRGYAFSKEFLVKMENENGKELKNRYLLDYSSKVFFETECLPFLTEGVDYWYINNSIVVYKNRFDKWYESQMEPLKEWLLLDSTLEAFNLSQYNQYAEDIWKKYCKGGIGKWEMDSLSFYYTEHELAGVNKGKYNISEYIDIPQEPIVIDKIQKFDKRTGDVISEWDKYQLFKIVGTVLDKNANGKYITLLTTSGVVTVKFYDGAFAHYNKQISKRIPGENKKTVVEKSWFNRGNLLLITGIRRGDTFYPKRYYDSMYQHTVCLIEEVYDNGDIQLKYERERDDQ